MKIDFKPRRLVVISLFLLLLLYSLYQARFLILGPKIQITNPQNGQTMTDPLIFIEGTAKNVAYISLNDNQIFTDENGNWSEELIVSTGISIITVKAVDRFGRQVQKSIEIIYK